MKATFKRHQNIFAIAVFFLVCIPVFVFALQFFLERIAQKTQEIQKKTAQQESRNVQVANLGQFRSQQKTILEQQTLLNVFVGQTDDNKVLLARYIEDLAKQVGISITIAPQNQQAVSHGTVAKATDGEEDKVEPVIVPASSSFLPLTISTEGSYNAVLVFMEKMENMPYMSDIVKVSFIRKQTTDIATQQRVSQQRAVQEDVVDEKNIIASIDIVFYFKEDVPMEGKSSETKKRDENKK